MKRKLPTLAEFKETYLCNIGDVKSGKTRANYKRTFDIIIGKFGANFLLCKLTHTDVLGFVTSLTLKYRAQTINKYLSCFSVIYQCYIRTYGPAVVEKFPDAAWAMLHSDPFHKTMLRNTTKPKNHISISHIEFLRLLSACDALEYTELYDLIMVYRYLGLRKTEALELTADNICEDYIIVKSSKTNTERVIPLFTEVANILHSRTELDRKHLFSYKQSTLDRHFKEVVKNAEVNPDITLHTLRKTFGSALVEKVPLKLISSWLGHSSVKVTEKWYIVLNVDYSKWVNINQDNREKKKEYALE